VAAWAAASQASLTMLAAPAHAREELFKVRALHQRYLTGAAGGASVNDSAPNRGYQCLTTALRVVEGVAEALEPTASRRKTSLMMLSSAAVSSAWWHEGVRLCEGVAVRWSTHRSPLVDTAVHRCTEAALTRGCRPPTPFGERPSPCVHRRSPSNSPGSRLFSEPPVHF
jgi:hypothetical protein